MIWSSIVIIDDKWGVVRGVESIVDLDNERTDLCKKSRRKGGSLGGWYGGRKGVSAQSIICKKNIPKQKKGQRARLTPREINKTISKCGYCSVSISANEKFRISFHNPEVCVPRKWQCFPLAISCELVPCCVFFLTMRSQTDKATTSM